MQKNLNLVKLSIFSTIIVVKARIFQLDIAFGLCLLFLDSELYAHFCVYHKMSKILKTLLLFCSLWHAILCAELNTTVAQVKLLPADIEKALLLANAANTTESASSSEDTEIIEGEK